MSYVGIELTYQWDNDYQSHPGGGAINCPIIIIILDEPLDLGGIVGEDNNIRIFAEKA